MFAKSQVVSDPVAKSTLYFEKIRKQCKVFRFNVSKNRILFTLFLSFISSPGYILRLKI